MADRAEINISKIKIAGVGGLGMVAMVGVVAYAMPEARQFVLLSYGAGVIGAFAFIAYRRWMRPERPHRPTLMTVNTPEPIGEKKDPRSLTSIRLQSGTRSLARAAARPNRARFAIITGNCVAWGRRSLY